MTSAIAPGRGAQSNGARRPGQAAPSVEGNGSQVSSLVTSQAFQEQVKLALPKHISSEKFLRVVLTELRKNPKLAECDKASFAAALMASAQLGLEVGSTLGLAYLIPRRNRRQNIVECQFQLGYKGMLQLIRNSGEVSSVSIRSVGANDEFSYCYGLNEDLRHVPSQADPGPLQFVYAVVRMKDGAVQFDVMSRAQIEEVRDKHAQVTDSSSPWVSHFEEMAKKTVLRRLFKYLPVGTELATAVALDEQGERDRDQLVASMVSVVPTETASLPESSAPADQQALPESAAEAQPQPEPPTQGPAFVNNEQLKTMRSAIERLELVEALPVITADLQQRGIESLYKLPAEYFSWFMSCLQTPATVDHWKNGLSIDGDRLEVKAPFEPEMAGEDPVPPVEPNQKEPSARPRRGLTSASAQPVGVETQTEAAPVAASTTAPAPGPEQQSELLPDPEQQGDPDPYAGAA